MYNSPMKFLENLQITEASKIYLTGVIFSIIALFVITAVVFLWLFFDKINIIMSQPSNETYAYFLLIMGRILALITVFMIIPLGIYQIISKNKSKTDVIISALAGAILTIFIFVFFGGQMYVYQKYSSGELSNSKLFENPILETRIYDSFMNR